MEAPSTDLQTLHLSTVTIEDGKTYCRCAKGWKCEFTRNEPSLTAPFKAFCKSRGTSFRSEDTSCCSKPKHLTLSEADGEGSNLQQTVESATGGNVVVLCGKGWTCTVTKTDGSDSGKDFFQCGNGCRCVIDETTGVAKCRCAC